MSGKNWKKTKKFQKPKSCMQLPYHLIHNRYLIFFTWKIEIINFKSSDFCKLLRLPASPILKIQKFSFGYVDFYAKSFLILYPSLENSTTPTVITYILKITTYIMCWGLVFGEGLVCERQLCSLGWGELDFGLSVDFEIFFFVITHFIVYGINPPLLMKSFSLLLLVWVS